MPSAFEFTYLKEACSHLINNGIMLSYTDTIVGLSVDSTSKTAIKALTKLKQRSLKKPFIIAFCSINQVKEHLNITSFEQNILTTVSPRPTTYVIPFRKKKNSAIQMNLDTVAIRIINPCIFRSLIEYYKTPLITTSANASNTPSAKSIDNVSQTIKVGCSYILKQGKSTELASKIIKIKKDSKLFVIRE